MREKLRPGRKKGSFTDPEKWEAKQREVDEFYVNEVGGTLAPGDHMVDPAHASVLIKERYGKGPSPSDIVEKFLYNTKSVTITSKKKDIIDVYSGFNIPVMEDTQNGSLHNASNRPYESMNPQEVRFWMPASAVFSWHEKQLAIAGENRVKHLLAM